MPYFIFGTSVGHKTLIVSVFVFNVFVYIHIYFYKYWSIFLFYFMSRVLFVPGVKTKKQMLQTNKVENLLNKFTN